MTCYATTRVSIRWPPENAYEDTTTLVLAVSYYFVDVRVKRDLSRIDWAFAGTKRVEEDGRHVWTHEIDSRNCLDEDSGYVQDLPNGDELEKGQMRNPDAGNRIMQHEEVWRSLPLQEAVGAIARTLDKEQWIAVVDKYLLRIHSINSVFSVASYTKDATTWHKRFSVGTLEFPDTLTDSEVDSIFHDPHWETVAKEAK